MLYEYILNVPKDTKKDSPASMEALVEPGILIYGEVFMPAGCNGMVHCIVKQGEFQLWPRNPEKDIVTDDHAVPINEHFPITRGNNILTIYGWSPNTIYQHNITVRLTVEPPDIASPLTIVRDFVTVLKKVMGL